MFKRVFIVGAVIFGGALCAAEGNAASSKEATSNSEPPAAVSKDLLKFLEVKLNLKVSKMSPQLALAWQLKLADVPLTVRETKAVAEKKVDFDLVDTTLAEALRVINTKTGCKYRIVKNEIRLAMPEEWADIDSGKTTFDKLVPEEKAAAPAEKK